jgi:hypothetical protein
MMPARCDLIVYSKKMRKAQKGYEKMCNLFSVPHSIAIFFLFDDFSSTSFSFSLIVIG